AAFARFGLSSSDDAKLEKAMTLGADFGVNYRAERSWDDAVRRATQRIGAETILENAGPPSIAASVRAAAQGGRVAQIGFKAMDGPAIEVLDLMLNSVTVKPVMVGSRAMLARLVRAVAVNDIQVPISQTFSFNDALAAYSAAGQSNGFGKIVISNT
ncbi:MAG: zinc-binding dehydrogenase, partial [Pseudomonadota bacterium]